MMLHMNPYSSRDRGPSLSYGQVSTEIKTGGSILSGLAREYTETKYNLGLSLVKAFLGKGR